MVLRALSPNLHGVEQGVIFRNSLLRRIMQKEGWKDELNKIRADVPYDLWRKFYVKVPKNTAG